MPDTLSLYSGEFLVKSAWVGGRPGKSGGRAVSLLAIATMLLHAAGPARANGFAGSPTDTGAAFTVSQGTNTDTITLHSPTAIITWAPTDTQTGGGAIDFLPSGNTAIFRNDPNNQQGFTVLNRIIPSDASRSVALNGHVVTQLVNGSGNVTSNGGHVWFYSPGGLLIGGSAVFDVGGLLLTTGDPSANGSIAPGGAIAMATTGSTHGVVVSSGATINATATEQISGGTKSSAYVAMVSPIV